VHEVTLAEELEFIRRYLDLQQTRFQDRLSVTVPVAVGGDVVQRIF
jgi:sensor histidine kinase YesM